MRGAAQEGVKGENEGGREEGDEDNLANMEEDGDEGRTIAVT